MNKLILSINPIQQSDVKLEVRLNSEIVEHILNDTSIEVDLDLEIGFYTVSIALLSGPGDIDVFINQGTLDGTNFRHTLNTMFGVTEAGEKYQSKSLTHQTRVLYLPFINPIACWMASTANKIPARLFLQNLYDELTVYYPESLTIPESYPKLMKDYFKYNLDFHAHPKEDLNDPYCSKTVPWARLTGIEYDEAALTKEFNDNLEYLISSARVPTQGSLNKIEFQINTAWAVAEVILPTENYSWESAFRFDQKRLPNLYKLLEKFTDGEILHGFVGVLAPGDYITPHIDQYWMNEFVMNKYPGCSQIYIPINFKKGNYFKITNVGLIPLYDGPILVNNHDFSHALLNDSDEYRFSIGIVGPKCEIKK